MNLEKMALDDFNLFKQHKIYEYEINKKLNNEEYKKVFVSELIKEAVKLIERGYMIDIERYPDDQINMIKYNSEIGILPHQKDLLETEFNKKYPLGFTDDKIINSALADFDRFKNNKVTNFEIALKIERSDQYKNALTILFENEATELNNTRGYNFDITQYSADKISDILYQKKYIPESHILDLQIDFEQKFGNDFPRLEPHAKKDFNLFKQNKIPEEVIAYKLETDAPYKESFIKLFENNGRELSKNGQIIPDINNYAIQKINNIIDSFNKIPDTKKIEIITDYEQKNNIPCIYDVTSYDTENKTLKHDKIETLSIHDALSIFKITKNTPLLSIERKDLNQKLVPYLVNNELVFLSDKDITETNHKLSLDDTINYYLKNLNKENNDFDVFSKKMSSFLDTNNKQTNFENHSENITYLISQLDKNPEKFNQFSESFIKNGLIDNVEKQSNIKISDKIKTALKDKTDPITLFVETVKNKLFKETKFLIENKKNLELEKTYKNIQDTLFNQALGNAEKKLTQQNMTINQLEKHKNNQISF